MIDLKVEADQTDRVYSAETDVLPSTRGRYLASMAEVKGWLDFVINSPWFCKRFPSIGKIVLLDGFGRQRAKCWYHDGASHIALPRAYRFQLDVLHELVHVLASGGHGREFCSLYLSLVRHFISAEAARDLRQQFVFLGVKHRRAPQPDPWYDDWLGVDIY